MSVTERLAKIIGHGAAGRELAGYLARRGVRTRADLRRPEVLAQLPRAAQAGVLYAPVRVPRAAAEAVAEELARRLIAGRTPLKPVAVGSARRGALFSKDLDFLVVTRSEGALAAATLRPPVAGDRATIVTTYASGPRKRSIILRWDGQPGTRARHFRVDLFAATDAERPFALFHYTGSAGYNIRVRAHAKKQKLRLNQYGIFAANNRPAPGSEAIRTERDLAAFLGITYREPADRTR
jgi:DNA polymerase/3'-5' exonuclease PolX